MGFMGKPIWVDGKGTGPRFARKAIMRRSVTRRKKEELKKKRNASCARASGRGGTKEMIDRGATRFAIEK